jgi:hypothetical protein
MKNSNKTSKTTIAVMEQKEQGVKLKIKIAKLKNNRQCEKYVKTNGSNKSTT